jgi:Ca-activated chloride channel family protein
MTFIWPRMLWSLLLVPLFVVGYLLLQRRRWRITANYGSLGIVRGPSGKTPGFTRHLPQTVFLAGLTILTFTLARPQAVVSLPRVEGTVILAFDVSGSMAATDFKPTRMEAAKVAAQDFIQHQPPGVVIGVVGFSDGGFAVQPPTNDRDALLASIKRLSPTNGTSVAHGIEASLNTIDANNQATPLTYSNLLPTLTPTPTPMPKGTYTSAVIVLLSDGENNESPDPLAEAQVAADRGVRIYTVGIGSAAGTNVHVNGFTVHTQLDEATLKQIAQISGGAYYNAQNEQDLLKIYDSLGSSLVVKPEKTEITSLFAGASILVLLIGGVLSLAWFSRLP